MRPTRCVNDSRSADMIVCRIAVSLEYALEVAQEAFGTFSLTNLVCSLPNEVSRLHAEHLPGPPGTIEANRSGCVASGTGLPWVRT
jgi:hypothetical protein